MFKNLFLHLNAVTTSSEDSFVLEEKLQNNMESMKWIVKVSEPLDTAQVFEKVRLTLKSKSSLYLCVISFYNIDIGCPHYCRLRGSGLIDTPLNTFCCVAFCRRNGPQCSPWQRHPPATGASVAGQPSEQQEMSGNEASHHALCCFQCIPSCTRPAGDERLFAGADEL